MSQEIQLNSHAQAPHEEGSPPLSDSETHRSYPLKTSDIDRTAGSLIALNLTTSFFVLLMFAIWLTFQVQQMYSPLEVQFAARGNPGPDSGFMNNDIEEPAPLEVEALDAPTIEMTLTSVSEVIASMPSSSIAGAGEGGGSRGGEIRAVGKGGKKTLDAPQYERWDVRIEARDAKGFGRVLDHFGIEIGTFGGGDPHVHYASNFSAAIKTRQTRGGSAENRVRFAPKDSDGQRFTVELLKMAETPFRGRSIAHFYPDQLVAQLSLLELTRARGRPVRRTVFGVRKSGGKPHFYVAEQQYHPSN